MRRLVPLLALIGCVGTIGNPALAAPVSLVGQILRVELRSQGTGAWPPLEFSAGAQAPTLTVSSGLGSFQLPAVDLPGTAVVPVELFTGVTLLSSFNVGSASVGSLVYDGSAARATGVANARAIFGVLGGCCPLELPLGFGGGESVQLGAAALAISVTSSAGWGPGPASITGITVSTPGGALVNTAVLSGSDARTPGHAGFMTLVTPSRIRTNIPGFGVGVFGSLTLAFVPEPGLLLLLGSAAAWLAFAGWRRR